MYHRNGNGEINIIHLAKTATHNNYVLDAAAAMHFNFDGKSLLAFWKEKKGFPPMKSGIEMKRILDNPTFHLSKALRLISP